VVNSLYLKFLLVGSPVDGIASRIRWFTQAGRRHTHPELWEVFLEQQRLPLVLQRLLSPESCCVDVGCHIGSVLNLILKLSPKGRHIAIEASATKGGWLRERYPMVDVLQFAVSDRNGTAMFEEDIKNPGFSHLQEARIASGPVHAYEVPVRRLDDVIDSRVDFIKMDIEGGELLALHGARQTFEKWKPSLLLECGSEYENDVVRSNRRNLFEYLTETMQYKVYSFSDFLFEKGPLGYDEFRKCGLYPFRAFNFVALP
jgi:FkbM family methyltransferase